MKSIWCKTGKTLFDLSMQLTCRSTFGERYAWKIHYSRCKRGCRSVSRCWRPRTQHNTVHVDSVLGRGMTVGHPVHTPSLRNGVLRTNKSFAHQILEQRGGDHLMETSEATTWWWKAVLIFFKFKWIHLNRRLTGMMNRWGNRQLKSILSHVLQFTK